MKEFLATLVNAAGNKYADIVFFRDEDTAWRWVESRPNALFVEELHMSARWTGRHAY